MVHAVVSTGKRKGFRENMKRWLVCTHCLKVVEARMPHSCYLNFRETVTPEAFERQHEEQRARADELNRALDKRELPHLQEIPVVTPYRTREANQ